MISHQGGLRLSEEEAYALLGLAIASPGLLDKSSASALEKLARYCAQCGAQSHHLADLEASEPIPVGV